MTAHQNVEDARAVALVLRDDGAPDVGDGEPARRVAAWAGCHGGRQGPSGPVYISQVREPVHRLLLVLESLQAPMQATSPIHHDVLEEDPL